MRTIPAEPVADWAPTILVSKDVTDSEKVARFIKYVPEGYVAPEIVFSDAGPVAIAGRHCAMIARDGGLSADSIHTLGPHAWHQLLVGIRRSTSYPALARPPLVIGNSGHNAYFHFTFEAMGAVLASRLLAMGDIPLVAGSIDQSWQRELLDFFAVSPPPIQVAAGEIALFDAAVQTNLTGRLFSFAPHPVMLREFTRIAADLPPLQAGKRIYLSRLDAPTRRRMENEVELCALLRAHGFDVVDMGSTPVSGQAGAVRAAEIVVAPHGAALTNLLYARDGADGPRLIELLPQSHASRGYAKIAQAKRLDYTAIINPVAADEAVNLLMPWRCDLDLVAKIVGEL